VIRIALSARRGALVLLAAVPFAACAARTGSVPPAPDAAQRNVAYDVHEATIATLQADMAAGRVTAVALVDAYLARIAAYDRHGPALNSMLWLNPGARADAAALDAERRAGVLRGPLHGVPVILKDNFEVAGVPTTAGSLALATYVPAHDAAQVRLLRAAGAVILGKSNMQELASGITGISSLGGQTRNPYDPQRNPGGSSSGSGAAVAASFAALAWGSDTCGSIRIPAAVHNLFGLRPTKGLSSIAGIIPLALTQDVAGPLARTVTDLAFGLDATAGPDAADAATRIMDGRPPQRFVAALDTGALRGTRIGVLTTLFGEQPEDQEVAGIVRSAADALRARGADVVDVEIAGLDSLLRGTSVIDYEFAPQLADHLARTPGAPVRSVDDILERGLHHAALDGPLRRRAAAGTRDSPAYHAALARRDTLRAAVLRALDEQRLDAVIYPTLRRKPEVIGEPQRGSTCLLSAATGFPALAVPAGFTRDGLPVGFDLLGRTLDDARLLGFAYAYEQAVQPRRPPPFTPPLVHGRAPAPIAFEVALERAHAQFEYDAVRGTLAYRVDVRGVEPTALHAVTLDFAGTDRAGPVRHRLGGPGETSAAGTLRLDGADRADLLAGRLALAVHTAGGVTRAALGVPAVRGP
jgi:amidase